MAMETIPAKNGYKKLVFKKFGLHQSLGIAPNEKIPEEKMQAALAGSYGVKAQKEAQFAKNVLTKGA